MQSLNIAWPVGAIVESSANLHDTTFQCAIRDMDGQFMANVKARDASRIVEDFYADDARVLPPNQPIVSGKAAILDLWKKLLSAGLSAVAMRLQLSRPDNTVVGPDLYNQLFTLHGSTMMFLFAVPVMEAFAVYLVPLMVGTRNIAFPRLNAFSYWMFLAGGILLWGASIFNTGADNGWFSYVPLAGPQYGPGKRADICGELGSDAAAIPILLGLGMDELSVSIPSVPTVKAQVRSLKIADLHSLSRDALNCSSAQEVRDLVKRQLG